MYSRPLFTQNPNTAAEQAGITERNTRPGQQCVHLQKLTQQKCALSTARHSEQGSLEAKNEHLIFCVRSQMDMYFS